MHGSLGEKDKNIFDRELIFASLDRYLTYVLRKLKDLNYFECAQRIERFSVFTALFENYFETQKII